MRLLHRFRRLSSSDRTLIIRALVLVCVFRVRLWLCPWRISTVRTGYARHVRRRSWDSEGSIQSLDRIGWAVRAASRFVPGTRCLVQALAAKVLLERAGQPVRFLIGVAKEDQQLDAHAWVEVGGNVITGQGNLERYAVLWDSTGIPDLS